MNSWLHGTNPWLCRSGLGSDELTAGPKKGQLNPFFPYPPTSKENNVTRSRNREVVIWNKNKALQKFQSRKTNKKEIRDDF